MRLTLEGQHRIIGLSRTDQVSKQEYVWEEAKKRVGDVKKKASESWNLARPVDKEESCWNLGENDVVIP